MTDHADAIAAAMQCLEDFMAAFNARIVDVNIVVLASMVASVLVLVVIGKSDPGD